MRGRDRAQAVAFLHDVSGAERRFEKHHDESLTRGGVGADHSLQLVQLAGQAIGRRVEDGDEGKRRRRRVHLCVGDAATSACGRRKGEDSRQQAQPAGRAPITALRFPLYEVHRFVRWRAWALPMAKRAGPADYAPTGPLGHGLSGTSKHC